jgi:SAM-dependent methyltransferase
MAVLKPSKLPLFPFLVAREKLARGERPREPEPMVMDEPQAVAEYDQIGATLQVGAHHFNARAISRLLPEGGTLIDLGCGSGRLLARLADGRPDARIIGLDLSEPMLTTGRSLLERKGLADRVELRRGDITTFDAEVAEQPDVVSCNFALHQLPSEDLARGCLEAIARARAESGCAVWIFDFARLRHPRTWPAFTAMMRWPGPVVLGDAIASERAAFTQAELIALFERAGLDDLQPVRSRPLGELQVAWAESRNGVPATAGLWHDSPLPQEARLLTSIILRSFPRSLTRPNGAGERRGG